MGGGDAGGAEVEEEAEGGEEPAAKTVAGRFSRKVKNVADRLGRNAKKAAVMTGRSVKNAAMGVRSSGLRAAGRAWAAGSKLRPSSDDLLALAELLAGFANALKPSDEQSDSIYHM